MVDDGEEEIKHKTRTHHIWIIRIHTHIREWVQSGHGSIPQMTVQLRQRVVHVLPRLHRRQLLWRGGGGGRGCIGGSGGAFDHVDGVGGLDLVD